jgi:hypothetical protein
MRAFSKKVMGILSQTHLGSVVDLYSSLQGFHQIPVNLSAKDIPMRNTRLFSLIRGLSLFAIITLIGVSSREVTAQGLASAFSQKESPAQAESMGFLKEYLLYGADSSWQGMESKNAYKLNSEGDASGIKFFFLNTQPEHDGKRGVGVNVHPVGDGSCGLIYGYRADPSRYFLVLVDARQNLRVLERSPEGFHEMLSITIDVQGPVRLDLVEKGSEIEIHVNKVNMLSIGNDRIGTGGVGIAAVGNGNFVFSDFTLDVNEASTQR